jgi:ADP-ribosylglycohydrolase
MRSPIIGATVEDDERRITLTRASTRITHTDPKAEQGAQVIALAASLARANQMIEAGAFAARVAELLGADGAELALLISGAAESVTAGHSTPEYADSIGLGTGVSGYVMDTVPVAIHAYLSHQDDYRRAVMSVIECGGDADTTAAIVGGIVCAGAGPEGIPDSWLTGLKDWPRSTGWIRRLGLAFTNADGVLGTPKLFAPAIVLRNLFFLVVVLLHGFRRLLPPY